MIIYNNNRKIYADLAIFNISQQVCVVKRESSCGRKWLMLLLIALVCVNLDGKEKLFVIKSKKSQTLLKKKDLEINAFLYMKRNLNC